MPDTDLVSFDTPNDIGDNGRQEIADSIDKLVTDAFVLYTETKNFHWDMKTERRTWFLFEATQGADQTGH